MSIEQQPVNQKLVLVGFAYGLVVLYDFEARIIQRRFDRIGKVLDWLSNVSLSSTFVMARTVIVFLL